MAKSSFFFKQKPERSLISLEFTSFFIAISWRKPLRGFVIRQFEKSKNSLNEAFIKFKIEQSLDASYSHIEKRIKRWTFAFQVQY